MKIVRSKNDKWVKPGYFYIGVAEHEGDVRSADVTVSVIRAVKPVKFFKELAMSGKAVTNVRKGIYYIGGITDLPLRVVVTSELADKIMKEDLVMADILMEIMKDEIDARCRAERQEEQCETRVLAIRSLMKNANWTEEQAMDNLDIPLDQRAMYAKLVKNQ